jgi:hypothetical protein
VGIGDHRKKKMRGAREIAKEPLSLNDIQKGSRSGRKALRGLKVRGLKRSVNSLSLQPM